MAVLAASHSNIFKRVIMRFPQDYLKFCFAYGSGVFDQVNNLSDKNMVDFIFTVDDAEKWHYLNMSLNPSHYSALKIFGSNVIAKVQTNFASKLYFNAMIPIKDERIMIKYGVITENDLIADLLDWQYLYVAGRLQKPVKIVFDKTSSEVKAALQLNLQSAAHAALLMLPENFTDVEFYKTITALSYNGDFRMIFGEDKNKVSNIVHGHKHKFKCLYEPILTGMSDYVQIPDVKSKETGDFNCCQDLRSGKQVIYSVMERLVTMDEGGNLNNNFEESPSAKHYHLNNLPRTVQRNLVKYWNKGLITRQDTEDVLRAMAFDRDCGEVLSTILSSIVWEASMKQSCKGILTAGVIKSIKYSKKKIEKMISSKLSPHKT